MSMRRFSRWLLLVMLAVMAVFATECSLQLSEIEVANQSNDTIRVADSQLSCKDQPKLTELHTHELAPGEARRVLVATGVPLDDTCIFVGDLNGHVASALIKHHEAFAVTNSGGALQVQMTGESSGGVDFSLSGPPTWALLIFGVPLLLGGLFALWITVSFFYGYYVQGKR